MDPKEVNTILIDVDGVLTDGKVWVSSSGERSKGFHSRDIRAIRELVSYGFDVHLVTASTWPGLTSYCKKVGALPHVSRNKSSVRQMFAAYIAIGDDAWDVEMLKGATKAYVPSDADESVRNLPGVTVLKTAGGCGVVAELVRLLIPNPQILPHHSS